MKKTLCIILCLGLLIAFVVPAYAEITPIEIGPNPGIVGHKTNQPPFDITGLSKEQIFEKIEEYYKENKVHTLDEINTANEIVSLYNTNNSGISVCSNYDEGAAQLRTGNLIELTLDIDEGISETRALRAIALADDAKDDAEANFPNSLLDSARHFMWNYKMTDTYNALTARTVGVNHEWGIIMITPMINHYNGEYEDFIAAGCSESEASQRALANTILYIPEFKYTSVELMEASYNFFASMFSDDCIMDFWNNCYGRAYAQDGYSSCVTAYTAAKNAGELILASSNVTYDHKWSVWSWDWYSY